MDGLVKNLGNVTEFDESIGQEMERPAASTRGRSSVGEGDAVGFLFAVEQSRPARNGRSTRGPWRPPSMNEWPEAMDCNRSEVQSAASWFIEPGPTPEPAIGLEQGACQLARRWLAFGEKCFQVAAFLGGESDDELLIHDQTPPSNSCETAWNGRKFREVINTTLTGH
jgi:hypothetical protein